LHHPPSPGRRGRVHYPASDRPARYDAVVALIHMNDDRDERLADYRNVPDPELLHRRGLFVAEGRLVVRRLVEGARLAARSAMVTAAGLAALDDLLPGRPDLPVYVVPQRVMDGVI